jgi:hypothetical protein
MEADEMTLKRSHIRYSCEFTSNDLAFFHWQKDSLGTICIATVMCWGLLGKGGRYIDFNQ